MSMELVGSGGRVSVLLTARRKTVPILSSQLRAFFPEVTLEEGHDLLLTTWEAGDDGFSSALELGLVREFMLPLERSSRFSPDPLTAIAGALAKAGPGEVAIVQVLFQGVAAPWAESVALSVITPSGDPFFADGPEVTKLAREKVSEPLFAVALRAVWTQELVHAAEHRLGRLKTNPTPDDATESEVVAELGGEILLEALGRSEDVDLGHCYRYLFHYCDGAGDVLATCDRLLKRTLSAVTLILDTADQLAAGRSAAA